MLCIHNRSRIVRSLASLALLATCNMLYAGPLDPPAGPVAPTYKTLSEVEPRIAVNATNTPGDNDATPSTYKITQSGSYYLTGKIFGESSKHGIEIAADGVTLDLMGFDVVGQGQGGIDGVIVTGPNVLITVRNGSVRNWGGDAINTGEFGLFSFRVENVRAVGGRHGIYAGVNSTITGCSSFGGEIGINARSGSTISDCSATRTSIAGIVTSNGCSLTNCSAYNNTGNGFSTAAGCVLTNCTAYDNTNNGFNTGLNCSLTNCSATTNGAVGFLAGTSNSFTNCSANTSASHGFSANSGSTITSCSSYNNTGHGFLVAAGSTVADCNARSNVLDGIRCTNDCVVRGNACSGSGFGAGDGAGVHATGANNRIEGNNCSAADRGVDVDVAGNIIIRNTCKANTINWVIAANNIFGPILDRTTQVTAAVSGNSATDSIGSAHPNANITY